ncbi:hypothetical protein [Streptomyces sp. NPDC054797]
MVRARLHHLLWEAQHGVRPIDHVSAAIASYREVVPVLLDDLFQGVSDRRRSVSVGRFVRWRRCARSRWSARRCVA